VNDGEPGKFRATFEDKILMSDLVVCRVWVPVEVQKFYNPVLSLLHQSGGDDDGVSSSWRGMRSVAEIRRESQIPIPVNKDSLYKPITRAPVEFRKMVIPKKLQEVPCIIITARCDYAVV
jgi:ribosome biogenesis protein BMS1